MEEKPNLIIQTAFIGDVLLSLALVKNLKSKDSIYKDQKLIYYCRKGLKDFLLQTKFVDEVIEVEKSSKHSIIEAEKKLLEKDYNLIISPHESFRTHMLIKKLKATKKIGFKKWWNAFFFDHRVQRNISWPDALRQLSLLSPILLNWENTYLKKIQNTLNSIKTIKVDKNINQINIEIPPELSLEFLVDQHSQVIQKSQIGTEQEFLKKIVAIAPGSTWATKMWPIESFKNLCLMLIEKGYEVQLFGSHEEVSLCNELSKVDKNIKDFSGQLSLYESFLKISKADFLVSNDSGAMHLGALSNRKIIAIFGPTVPSFGYYPWVKAAIIVEDKQLDCRPCGKHGAKKCPIGTHLCMTNLNSKSVLKAIEWKSEFA